MKKENYIMSKDEMMTKKINFCIIECISGVVWITHKNSNDIILTKGNTINIEQKTKILIQALENSSIKILHPDRSLLLKGKIRFFMQIPLKQLT